MRCVLGRPGRSKSQRAAACGHAQIRKHVNTRWAAAVSSPRKYLCKNKTKFTDKNIVLALPAATVPLDESTCLGTADEFACLRATTAGWCFLFSRCCCARSIFSARVCLGLYNIHVQARKRAASLATTLHLQRRWSRTAGSQMGQLCCLLPATCSPSSQVSKCPYSADRSESLYYAT